MTPAIGLAAADKQRPPAISLSFDKISTFTPAGADPRLAAIFAGRGALDRRFQIHAGGRQGPSVAAASRGSRPRRGRLRPGRSRSRSPRQSTSLAPAQYDLGVAVGWKRFAVSGDVARSSSPDPVIGTRETAVVGVSYNLKKFTGRVAVGGERNDSRVAPLARPDSMSVDVGGSYNISRNIALTGGVRYKVERDQIPALADDQPRQQGRLRRHRLQVLSLSVLQPAIDSPSISRPWEARLGYRRPAFQASAAKAAWLPDAEVIPPSAIAGQPAIAASAAARSTAQSGAPGCERVGKTGETKASAAPASRAASRFRSSWTASRRAMAAASCRDYAPAPRPSRSAKLPARRRRPASASARCADRGHPQPKLEPLRIARASNGERQCRRARRNPRRSPPTAARRSARRSSAIRAAMGAGSLPSPLPIARANDRRRNPPGRCSRPDRARGQAGAARGRTT